MIQVRRAACYLGTTPLWIRHGNRYDPAWEEPQEEAEEKDDSEKDCRSSDSDSEDSEGSEEAQPGAEGSTMVDDDGGATAARDVLDHYDWAPAESATPVPHFLDPESDALAFPSLWLGRPRPSNDDRDTKVTLSEEVKALLRSTDRSAASHPTLLPYYFKRLQYDTMARTITTYLRRHNKTTRDGASDNRRLTAGFIRSKEAVQSMLRSCSAYSATKSVRGSPAYFNSRASHLNGMIRSLGTPTWFMTKSVSETR